MICFASHSHKHTADSCVMLVFAIFLIYDTDVRDVTVQREDAWARSVYLLPKSIFLYITCWRNEIFLSFSRPAICFRCNSVLSPLHLFITRSTASESDSATHNHLHHHRLSFLSGLQRNGNHVHDLLSRRR